MAEKTQSPKVDTEEGKGFFIEPIKDCPHLNQVDSTHKASIDPQAICPMCPNAKENWVCLTCYSIGCGRHESGHALEHWQEKKHSVALGFADLSVWCYECEAYIDNDAVNTIRNVVHDSKFHKEGEEVSNHREENKADSVERGGCS